METRATLEISADDRKTSYRNAIFKWIEISLFTVGSILVSRELMSLSAGSCLLLLVIAVFGMFSCGLAVRFGKKQPVISLLWILPWLLLILYTGVHSPWIGAKGWWNVIISRWNMVHESGLPLLPGNPDLADVQNFLLLLTLLSAQVTVWMVSRGHKLGAAVYCLFWILVQTHGQCFNALAGSFLLSGILGMCMLQKQAVITKLKLQGILFIMLVLVLGTLGTPQAEMKSVTRFRNSTEQGLRELRYGKDVLPEGNLSEAFILKQDTDEMLLVHTDQKKSLYLKGFVGETYENGKWRELSASAFGGENTGLLRWLYRHDFDPLTQSATYYRLGSESEELKENHVVVTTADASRVYVYVPASLSEIQADGLIRKKDNRLGSFKLTGEGFYEYEEISGAKPSEILVAEDWVSNPETPEQASYAQAETVYRRFVYEHDTAIDRSMYQTMYELFWKDYDNGNDGIYSAVSYVRKRLSELAAYSEEIDEIPEEEEPIRWFLTKEHKGNAVWYASAATMAFRAHGIPARYVEGYYISKEAVSRNADGALSVSGRQAHAWVEIYFDGIGWLSVDVTPGYYFDAVTLQQMVGMPDTIHKTAALQNDPLMAEQLTDTPENEPEIPEVLKEAAHDVGVIYLGAAAVVLIFLTIFVCVTELLRMLLLLTERRKDKREDAISRVKRRKIRLYHILSLWGIEAHLGFQTQKTDQEIAQRVEQIGDGEYSRVCQLMEKAVYGNVALAPYEERTLNAFLDKISVAQKSEKLKTRLKLHYQELLLWFGRKRKRTKQDG